MAYALFSKTHLSEGEDLAEGPGTRSRRVPDVDSNGRLLIVPPFRGSSRFESLILSHHSRTKLHVSVMNEVKAEADLAEGRDHVGHGEAVHVVQTPAPHTKSNRHTKSNHKPNPITTHQIKSRCKGAVHVVQTPAPQTRSIAPAPQIKSNQTNQICERDQYYSTHGRHACTPAEAASRVAARV
jgi:hypothetical protein